MEYKTMKTEKASEYATAVKSSGYDGLELLAQRPFEGGTSIKYWM
ncbi:MAG: hypothetical protein QME12_08530 [Nanoarchaeota archaeon]|nr:hypothetical protein [Nanoarchaeota archaeon]